MRKRVVICERTRENEKNYSNTRIHTQNDTVAELLDARNAAKISTLFDSVAVWQMAPVWQWNGHFLSFSCQMVQACKRWPLAKCWPDFDISSQHVEDLLFSCRSAYWNQLMVFLDLVCLPSKMRNKTEPFSYQTGYSAFPFRSRLSVRRRTEWNEWKLKLSQPQTHTKQKLSRHFFGRFQPSRMTFFFPVLLFLTVILVFPKYEWH